MKIGILTVYFADFGSFFQATSLYYVIKKMGYDVEIINASLREKKSFRLKVSNLAYRFAPKIIINFLSKIENRFRKFVLLKNDIKRKNIKISKRYKHWNQLDENYDLVIVGSDELWSYTNKNIGYIPGYFGIGYRCPHIAYAPSAASLKLSTNDKLYSKVRRGLETFSEIGVRDERTKRIVKRLTGLDSKIVLDPSLLNPYFLKKNKRKVNKSDYILVYGEEFNKSFIRSVKKFARENNLKILSISWNHDWCDEFIDVDSAFRFHDYYRNCSYCVTSNFHGVIFAILHRKRFLVQLTKLRGKKVKQFLKAFGLTDRIYGRRIDFKDIKNMDYRKVNKILEMERKKSYQYLKSAINKVEKKYEENM